MRDPRRIFYGAGIFMAGSAEFREPLFLSTRATWRQSRQVALVLKGRIGLRATAEFDGSRQTYRPIQSRFPSEQKFGTE